MCYILYEWNLEYVGKYGRILLKRKGNCLRIWNAYGFPCTQLIIIEKGCWRGLRESMYSQKNMFWFPLFYGTCSFKYFFMQNLYLLPCIGWLGCLFVRSHWYLVIFCHLGETLASKTRTPCILLLNSLRELDNGLEPLIRRYFLNEQYSLK